jgi:hypothetical protein
VGLEDVRDPHVLLGGGLDIGLDVLLWIHHSAAGCTPSAEEVAGAAGLGGQELAENHGDLLLPELGGWVASRYPGPIDKLQYCFLTRSIGLGLWHDAQAA